MTLDLTTLALSALGVVCAVLGWFARELWQAVKELRKDLSVLQVRVSDEFVRYDRMQDVMQPIMLKLDRIEDALQRKVDK